jgi:hypothetical protein
MSRGGTDVSRISPELLSLVAEEIAGDHPVLGPAE